MSYEKPKPRRTIGFFILLIGLALYIMGASLIGEKLNNSSILIQTLYYLVAGILWIFPANQIIKWINKIN